jgi:hypothetical protein
VSLWAWFPKLGSVFFSANCASRLMQLHTSPIRSASDATSARFVGIKLAGSLPSGPIPHFEARNVIRSRDQAWSLRNLPDW